MQPSLLLLADLVLIRAAILVLHCIYFRCLGDLDIDGDGVIDDDEYATAVRAGLVTAALDLDDDGIIDESEKAAARRAGLTLPEATTVSDPAVESKLNTNKMHGLREAQMNPMLGAFDAVDPDETEMAPRLDLRKEIEKHVAACAQVQQLADHVRNLDCMIVEKDEFEEIVQMWVDGTL